MQRLVLSAMVFLLAACAATSPYTAIHAGKPQPPMPVPTAGHPDAYNYLPAVLGGECSEAEYPLFAGLSGQSIEQTRPLLETLGIIADHRLMQGGADEGWMRAINTRQRLFWKKQFATPEGSRIAWLFIRASGGGNQGQRFRATAIVTSGDQQVIAYKPTTIWMAFELRPVPQTYPDATVLEVVNRYDRAEDRATRRVGTGQEFIPDVIRYTASAIEITSHEGSPGNSPPKATPTNQLQ